MLRRISPKWNNCYQDTRPLEEDEALASQSTLSRLLGILNGERIVAVLYKVVQTEGAEVEVECDAHRNVHPAKSSSRIVLTLTV